MIYCYAFIYFVLGIKFWFYKCYLSESSSSCIFPNFEEKLTFHVLPTHVGDSARSLLAYSQFTSLLIFPFGMKFLVPDNFKSPSILQAFLLVIFQEVLFLKGRKED